MINSNKNYRRRGVALVELSLVLSILLVLSLLIIQYGIIVNTAVGLTNLSREGARYAAVNPATNDPIIGYMRQVSPPSVNFDRDVASNIVIWSSGTRAVGSKAIIRVTINYNMANRLFLPTTIRFPFMRPITIFSTTYKAESSMMIE